MTRPQLPLPLLDWSDLDRVVEWLQSGDGAHSWWAGRRMIDVPVKGDRL